MPIGTKERIYICCSSKNKCYMYRVKPLYISGGDIYDVSNGQLTNGRMCEMQYLIMYKQNAD